MNRDFKGVWIPRNIWEDKKLTWGEKLLFLEIDSLATRSGECFASNEHFAEFLDVSPRQIQNILSALKNKGIITIQLIYKGNTKIVCKRIIRPTYIKTDEEKFAHTDEESFAHMNEEKFARTDEEKFVDSNTLSFNNTISNTSNKKINKKNSNSAEMESEFESLWKKYPRKIGKQKALLNYIKARKGDKYTFEAIANGIEMYINYIHYHNVSDEYIQHGSTWFNQESWNNDYSCKPRVVKGGKRGGFLGSMANEIDAHRMDIIDYEGTIIHEQERNEEVIDYASYSLPFGI